MSIIRPGVNASTSPARGDVVIAVLGIGGYSIRQFPSAPQVRCGSLLAAQDLALMFSSHHDVRVWFEDREMFLPCHAATARLR
jgi:hypothetical protein